MKIPDHYWKKGTDRNVQVEWQLRIGHLFGFGITKTDALADFISRTERVSTEYDDPIALEYGGSMALVWYSIIHLQWVYNMLHPEPREAGRYRLGVTIPTERDKASVIRHAKRLLVGNAWEPGMSQLPDSARYFLNNEEDSEHLDYMYSRYQETHDANNR